MTTEHPHLTIDPSTSHDSLGITLPWEEEGADHAHEETDSLHSGPLHVKSSVSDTHQIDTTKAHQSALRLRAAKYFRGSPRPFSPTEGGEWKRPPGFFPRTSTTSPPLPTSPSFPSSTSKSPSPTFSKYSDPPLEDQSSTFSVTATSVSYGSDLENAARRILDRKKGRGANVSGLGSVSGAGSVSDSLEGSAAGESSANVWGLRRNTAQQQQQQQHRRPSRERMQKITRRNLSLPTKYSDTEDEFDEEKPELFPTGNEHNANIVSPYEEDETAAILRDNAEKNRRRSHCDEEEEEETGAFPSIRPDPLDENQEEDELQHNASFHESQDWNWNDVTSSSWVDPSRAFMDVGDDDDEENQYDDVYVHQMEHGADNDLQDHSLNYTTSDIVQNTTENEWDEKWYQCEMDISSVEEEGESEEEEKEFDGDDYFHDFGKLNHDSDWGMKNPNQQVTGWEDLPSPVEFSPRRRRLHGAGRVGDDGRVEEFQDDEYVTRTSEIDFFAWDDDVVDGNTNRAAPGDFDEACQDPSAKRENPGDFGETCQDPPSMDIMPEKPKAKSKGRDEQHQTKVNMSPQTYPLSDGDTPTRKARMGLSFFRSRNHPVGSWNFQSEEERSNSDWESSSKKSSKLTPLRSTRWKNKQKIQMSPRNFFERRQEKQKKTEKEPPVLSAQYEMLRKDSDLSKSFISNFSQEGMDMVENATDTPKSTVNASGVLPSEKQVVETHNQAKSPKTTIAVNTRPKDAIPSTPTSSNLPAASTLRTITPVTNLNDSMFRSTQMAPKHDQTKTSETAIPVNTRQKDAISSTPTSAKPYAVSTIQTGTPVTNLNDSMLTQTTPLMSNKGLLNEMPRPPSFGKNNPYQAGGQAAKSPRLPPHVHNSPPGKKVSKSRKKPPSPGFTGSDIIVDKKEEDDACSVSTLNTESLGSLVTKPAPTRGKTDASVRSGMSEIERLRRENERLREKLENRSEASSKVSSAYVRTLQEQNKLLRRHLNNSSPKRRTSIKRNDSDMMYKSTIATLLEKEDPTRRRRHRHKNNSSPRKSRGTHGRKPVAPLIHADFDDESITTYSESIEGKGVQLSEGVPGILQAIATTSHKVASQVKTATQDRNKSTSINDRSCELFTTVCRRRNSTGGKEIRTCGSSVHSTKEVIGRAFGCIKPNHVDGKAKHETSKSGVNSAGSVQTTDSDSLNHGTASYDEPKIMFAGTPGVSVQL